MIRHVWSLLCSKSLIDKDTNNLSVTDILERIVVEVEKNKDTNRPKVINIPIKFELVTLWYREKIGKVEKFEIRFRVLDPSDKELTVLSYFPQFEPKHKRLRTRIQLRGFTITRSGDYRILVEFRGNKKAQFVPAAEIPIEVVVNKK